MIAIGQHASMIWWSWESSDGLIGPAARSTERFAAEPDDRRSRSRAWDKFHSQIRCAMLFIFGRAKSFLVQTPRVKSLILNPSRPRLHRDLLGVSLETKSQSSMSTEQKSQIMFSKWCLIHPFIIIHVLYSNYIFWKGLLFGQSADNLYPSILKVEKYLSTWWISNNLS